MADALTDFIDTAVASSGERPYNYHSYYHVGGILWRIIWLEL
ncbi:MAG TPA: hypothetical protein PLD25_00880 [Chloroflexota bacterium]|nr:hypothetical protein [Chloroflexota bacterium]